jgi:hypothetical protein
MIKHKKLENKFKNDTKLRRTLIKMRSFQFYTPVKAANYDYSMRVGWSNSFQYILLIIASSYAQSFRSNAETREKYSGIAICKGNKVDQITGLPGYWNKPYRVTGIERLLSLLPLFPPYTLDRIKSRYVRA